MFKKKKNTHTKDNQQQLTKSKKIPNLNINIPSQIQQSRIKTLPCIDLKHPVKSIEFQKQLQKQYSNSKKNISRKTTSRTMRLDNSIKPSTLHVLLKQVKERKKTQIAECKSRSPKNRSRSGNKTKLSRSQQLKHKSERRLSLKIGNTIRRMQFYDFVHQEDDNIVYPSASTRPNHGGHVSSVSDIEGINLEQIKRFSSSQITQDNRLKVQLKSGDSLQQTIAAITIQRAWRTYTTKKLVSQYTKFSYPSESYISNIEPSEHLAELQLTPNSSYVVIPSEKDFYGQQQVEDVQNISNLEDSHTDSMQEKVKQVKLQQLEKWNSILLMIEATKNSSQQQRQKLFKQIARQSEKNREELILITQRQKQQKKTKKSARKKKEEDIQQEDMRVKLQTKKGSPEDRRLYQEQLLSQASSQPLPLDSNITQHHLESQSDTNNYNSRKYIEQLDSDIFPEHSNSSSSIAMKKVIGTNTISAKKQQMLLESLYSRPAELPRYGHCTTLSLTQVSFSPREGPQAARRQAKMSRCTSQKVLKRTISNFSQLQSHDINLKMLEEEYLQMYPILNDDHDESLQDSHSSANFRTIELEEQKKMENPQPPKIKIQDDDQTPVNQQLDQFLNSVTTPGKEINNLNKISNQVEKDDKQFDDVVAQILGSLAYDFLKQITTYDRITSAVKKLIEGSKPKVKKADNNRKKRGFLTDKKQIELFLQNLINYVLTQQPGVLSNLEVPTGPSAIEMLRYMHSVDEDEPSEDSSSQEANIMVIPNRIFDSFWKIKQKSIVVEVPANFNEENSVAFRQNIEYLKSFNKIFYRSLFDTFNECLDWERNFGILGRPFPWKKCQKFNHKISFSQKKECLVTARQKMINISTTYCGLMVDTSELVSTAENDEYLQQVQEDRLSRMLASDLIESEHRWHFYDDEQAEILIEISNVLYRELLFQALEHLLDLQ